MNKVLGLDLDGVLYKWHHAVLTELKLHWKLDQDTTYDDFWTDGYKNFKTPAFWDNLVRIPFLYSVIPPDRGQMEMMNRLSKKHLLFYITNRPEESYLETQIYLDRYEYPQRDHLIFTDRKDLACISNGVDVYVEDRVHNALSLEKVTEVILFKQPYNKELWGRFKEISNILELEGVLND